MKHSPEMELLVVVVMGLWGLIFLWLIIPQPVAMFNYLPLFLFSYVLAMILPGYTFLRFTKPGMDFRTHLEMGLLLSLVFLLVVTSLFIFLEIPLAISYAVSVLMILSLVMAILTYLGARMEMRKLPPEEKTSPHDPGADTTQRVREPVPEADEKTQGSLEDPSLGRTRLTPPPGEVELIIPGHVHPGGGDGKIKARSTRETGEKSTLKLPWIERQKELDRKKK